MQMYEEAWKAIISPPQMKGRLKNYGPTERMIDDCKILRQDSCITNSQNKKLVGYYFFSPDIKASETILYLHGNGGSKYEALPLVDLIPKFKVNVVAFDFLGCGSSDSAYLTYGVKQCDDVKLIIDKIGEKFGKQKITLWGRSMGAQCAIMYAQRYPNDMAGMVLDSPFQKLEDVIDRIAKKQVSSVPNILMKPILYAIKNKVNQQAQHEIFEIDYLEIFSRVPSGLPVLFIYSHFDKIVPTEEVIKFHKIHKGPKDLCEIFQTHDEDRPKKIFVQGISWLMRTRKSFRENLIGEDVLKTWKGENQEKGK